ncbi:MAG: S-methyl-5'-thioinosine phosphorylase [Nitrososphaeria archaeon]
MQSSRFAIVAGTGMDKLFDLSDGQELKTPYGSVSIYLVRGLEQVYFLPRHGIDYSVPPHRINYRANVYALNMIGIKYVIATNAVGSLKKRLSPGSLVLPDQVIDFTKSRLSTFFEGEDGRVVFTDVTQPYSEAVRSAVIKAGKLLQITVYRRGTYVCTEGPRYETSAEILAFKKLGGDVVGMTGVPEVFLARELGIEYATIATVTNYAAGIVDRISHNLVLEIMRRSQEKVRSLILESMKVLREGEANR